MNKVKVIKKFDELDIDDVLVYNTESKIYEYSLTAEETSENSKYAASMYVSYSKAVVESLIEKGYLEYEEELDWSKAIYIKPVVVKALYNDNQVLVKAVDGTTIPVDLEIFNKLFKVIE